VYQERQYQSQPQTQQQLQGQVERRPYREWDERQQQRFPDSPLAQYDPDHRERPSQFNYPMQGQQSINVGQIERQLSVAAGAALVLYALINRSRASWITAPLGAALIWRGQTGHCPVYQALNVNTAQSQGTWQHNSGMQNNYRGQSNGGLQQIPIQRQDQQQQNQQQPSSSIEIRRSVTVNKPATELYNFWRKLENLPQFMQHLDQVTQTSEKSSHWHAKVAGGIPVEWDAEITEDMPGKRIAWRTKPDSQVQQVGVVAFKENSNGRGTVVDVDIRYTPPGGIIGETFGRLLNGVTTQQVENDINRFKSLMETGEIPTTEGQPSGRS
jgi:uncharacterized membrane protein